MRYDEYYIKPKNVKTRTGAGGVVARVEGEKVLAALIRDGSDHQYVIPKGGVEKGETLEQAARREIEEEAGLTELISLGELGIGERLNGRKKVWQTTHYFLFQTIQISGSPTDLHDWELGWFDLNELPEIYWPEQRALIQENHTVIRQKILAYGR